MPPKNKKGKSVPKKEPSPPPQPEEPARTRTRGKTTAKEETKAAKPIKKVKQNEAPPPKRTRTKSNLSAVSDEKKQMPAKKKVKEQVKPEDLKKVIMKGKAPVDQYVPGGSQYQVFSDATEVYATTLNQSNISSNNNKFYILQVLQHESNPSNWMFFTRWGRVGVPGQQAPVICGSSAMAIHQYNKKRRQKLNGGYRKVEMNYEEDEPEKKKEEKKEKVKLKGDEKQVKSTLNPQVQDLIKLIFDMRMMNNHMKEIGYDAKKMPLGKLAKGSILRGYEALKSLMDVVKKNKVMAQINRLSSDFYSEIPHDFGFQNMQNFVLDTEKKIKAKLQMLQTLQDIQIFTKMLDQGHINDVNQLDSNYLKLDTTVTPLDKNSDTYKLLVEYVDNTHGSSHTAYKLEVEDIFELSKDSQNRRFRADIDNKQLLWHGSRLTNYVGILSQGLRIAPPEAPVTGYMFGKGVYFADMVTKSANYCFTNASNNTGLMLLCEVALGGMNEKFNADYYANLLPPGKNSTKGCGKTAPGSGKYLDGGKLYVPCGVGAPTNVPMGSLLYNEFIVYDVAQIKSRYLFRMKFNYNYFRRSLFG